MIQIKSLHIYPIKSLGGIQVQASKITGRGLEHDRRWMLVDEKNQFISQRTLSELALLQPALFEEQMKIVDTSGQQQPLYFDLEEPLVSAEEVTVWDDTIPAKPVSKEANQWFSNYMQMPVKLMYMHEDSVRQADQRYAISMNDKVSFADGYPILIIGTASMAQLNQKLTVQLSIDRFRANIIVEGSKAHAEDTWRTISVGNNKLFGVKPCQRCTITTIDPKTAELGQEPLKTLATYRKVNNKILFGENFIPAAKGFVKVGDAIEVVALKSAAI